MIKSLLIANRGEIAVRVIQGARELGVRTVLAASEPDLASKAASLADEVVCLGSAAPAASYLNILGIIEAAKKTGCDAIHPGYGFLSERPEFVEACEEAGLIFVGPPASAMRQLGAKIDAKKLAVDCGVPITQGYFEPGASDADIAKAAEKIGYPVMLKASAGGGGRGMRIARSPEDLNELLPLAREEAKNAFGDADMMVEKLIEQPRHIEVQVVADTKGNIACLFERECSLQRRHQKVIEEAPSPVMTDGLWAQISDAAEKLIRASGYVGAGTVEFMTDAEARHFYFLEVNARLQVEHPVTEAIASVDLVKEQLRIASGEELTVSTEDRTQIAGHAIEARIIAEDPADGFMPSVGRILHWCEPQGPGIRVDSGFRTGDTITPFYDSLVAKLIVHSGTRQAAVQRMRAALQDFHILGVKTNIAYLLDVISLDDFSEARFDTNFLERELGEWTGNQDIPSELGLLVDAAEHSAGAGANKEAQLSCWDQTDGYRNA
jgi:acetyl/propionyl-CoA carboxylase alpha subunit